MDSIVGAAREWVVPSTAAGPPTIIGHARRAPDPPERHAPRRARGARVRVRPGGRGNGPVRRPRSGSLGRRNGQRPGLRGVGGAGPGPPGGPGRRDLRALAGVPGGHRSPDRPPRGRRDLRPGVLFGPSSGRGLRGSPPRHRTAEAGTSRWEKRNPPPRPPLGGSGFFPGPRSGRALATDLVGAR